MVEVRFYSCETRLLFVRVLVKMKRDDVCKVFDIEFGIS